MRVANSDVMAGTKAFARYLRQHPGEVEALPEAVRQDADPVDIVLRGDNIADDRQYRPHHDLHLLWQERNMVVTRRGVSPTAMCVMTRNPVRVLSWMVVSSDGNAKFLSVA